MVAGIDMKEELIRIAKDGLQQQRFGIR